MLHIIIILNVRRLWWPEGTRKIVMKLDFESSLGEGYESGSLKEGKISQARVKLN